MLREKLRRLDDRVLGLDKRMALLSTEDGWRQHAARWRPMAALAATFLCIAVFGGSSAQARSTPSGPWEASWHSRQGC